MGYDLSGVEYRKWRIFILLSVDAHSFYPLLPPVLQARNASVATRAPSLWAPS
jgi:hypothetical protein